MRQVALLAAVLALTAACARGEALSRLPAAAPAAPVTPLPAAPPSADAGCGDPTLSLRPAGPRPGPGAMPAGSYLKTIQDRGRLVAGVSRDTLLFGYQDPMSNQLQGFDIDLVRLLSRAIFGDENHVQFRVISEAQAVPSLQNGTVDVVARTLTMTCLRWQQVAFSTEYYHAVQRLMVARNSPAQGIEDLRGKPVCASAGSTSLAAIANAASHPTPVAATAWEDCLVLFQLGQVDAIAADDALLLGFTEQDPNAVIVGGGLGDAPYGLAIAQAHPDLVRFANSVLDDIRADHEWTALYSRWLGRFGPAPQPPAARYR